MGWHAMYLRGAPNFWPGGWSHTCGRWDYLFALKNSRLLAWALTGLIWTSFLRTWISCEIKDTLTTTTTTFLLVKHWMLKFMTILHFFFLRYIVYFRRITVHQCKYCILIGSATTRKDGKTKKRHRSLSELKILEVAVEKNDKHAYMIASFQMVKCSGMCYLI